MDITKLYKVESYNGIPTGEIKVINIDGIESGNYVVDGGCMLHNHYIPIHQVDKSWFYIFSSMELAISTTLGRIGEQMDILEKASDRLKNTRWNNG